METYQEMYNTLNKLAEANDLEGIDNYIQNYITECDGNRDMVKCNLGYFRGNGLNSKFDDVFNWKELKAFNKEELVVKKQELLNKEIAYLKQLPDFIKRKEDEVGKLKLEIEELGG